MQGVKNSAIIRVMTTTPRGKRGPRRKLSEDETKRLVSLWIDPENVRSDLADSFGLSRYGAYLVVSRFLDENAPDAETVAGHAQGHQTP